jgi:hypothetical protein
VFIISGIVAAVIIGLAIIIHLRLSALEPEGHKEGETANEVLNEILTGQPAHPEGGKESGEEHIEESKGSSHFESEASEEGGRT